ncbi:hypothetical protein ACWKW6_08950 [Dyadobacter jiangsuensis]
MKDKSLIASVALFSDLYNSESYRSIPDIIAEFIRGAIFFENKYSFSSTQIKDLLKKVYGFDIPESVIRTTLVNKLRTEIKRESSLFHYIGDKASIQKDINGDVEKISIQQAALLSSIYNFIEAKTRRTLSSADKEEVLANVFHFLLDNGYSEKYSDLISAFILIKEDDVDFREIVGSIKEGLILYQGIKYTPDINQLGTWQNDLTIYLSTEHLFNALGYNGVLFKEIFDDFLKLVAEINLGNKGSKSGKKRIELRYLEETKGEIDNFFQTAESIKKRVKILDPSKLAMQTIVDRCQTPSDIRTLRVQFDIELNRLGIHYQPFDYNFDRISEFNVTDQSVMDQLRKVSTEKGKTFDEDECRFFFGIFTKINTFRRGRNDNVFERCGHLFVTETSFAKYLAHNNLVKFSENSVAFAKDIDYVITRFWFALKKGFSDRQTIPKSFDVITKAKIILSGHLNNGISKMYEGLLADRKAGRLTDDEALARSFALRDKPNAPEEISTVNLDDTLELLQNENYLEDFYREKIRRDQLLEETQSKFADAQMELNAYKDKERREAEDALEAQFIARREEFVALEWKKRRLLRAKNFALFLGVLILTTALVTFPFVVSVSATLKTWFSRFDGLQITSIILYVIIAVVDVMGSRYLYKKDKISDGWNWFLSMFNYTTFVEAQKAEIRTTYTEGG